MKIFIYVRLPQWLKSIQNDYVFHLMSIFKIKSDLRAISLIHDSLIKDLNLTACQCVPYTKINLYN